MEKNNFLIELLKRFASRTPKFFKILQILAGAAAIITGLPLLLDQVGITLPEALKILENKAVAIAAVVAAFLAQLVQEDKPSEPVPTEPPVSKVPAEDTTTNSEISKT